MDIVTNTRGRGLEKSKLVGQKKPLRPRDVWAIRVRLQLASKARDLALFELAIDSKLRACDLVAMRLTEIACPPERLSCSAKRTALCNLKSQSTADVAYRNQRKGLIARYLTYFLP